MQLSAAIEAARASQHGVLVTLRKDGRPQLSNVVYQVDDQGSLRVSITSTRAKYHNLRRTPWAAMYIGREQFFAGYTVVEGSAHLSPVAAAVDDRTVEQLVDLYRSLGGEHQDWDEYRRAMVADHRVVLTITPESAYGMG